MARGGTIWQEEGPSEAGRSPDASESSQRSKTRLGGALMPLRIVKEVKRSWEDALGLLEQP